MTDKTLPYVRFFGYTKLGPAAKGDPGWWHLNNGDGRTRCGLKINAIASYEDVEFSGTAGQAFCLRCRPIH